MEELKTCPVCSGEEFSLLYKRGAPDRIKVRNNICHGCGSVFQSPRPTQKELSEYYAAYSDISQGAAIITPEVERHLIAIARLRYDFLSSCLKKGMRILDVGCGIGQLIYLLKNAGMEVEGINPEEKYAAYGRSKYGITIHTSMFEQAELKSSAYDLVIFDHVFEHINEPGNALKKVCAVLKPGGRLFISTNNVLTPHGFLWQNFFPDHAVTYSPATIRFLLGLHGFEIAKMDASGHITYEGYHYPYMNLMAVFTGRKVSCQGDAPHVVHEKLMSYKNSYIKNHFYHFIAYYAKIFAARYFSRYLGAAVYFGLTLPIPRKIRPRLYNHTLPPERL